MLRMETLDQYSWWSELKHGGLLIAPARLADYFPESLPPLPDYLAEKLRTAVQRMPPRSRALSTCSSASLIVPFSPNNKRSLKCAGSYNALAVQSAAVSYFDSGKVLAAFAKGAVLFDASDKYMVHASRRDRPGQAEGMAPIWLGPPG